MADTTSTKITVQWREVPYFNRNGDIVGYTVRYHSISGCSSATLHSETETLAATLVELIPFTNYSIEVAAVNVNGTGPFSTPVYLRTDGDSKWTNHLSYPKNKFIYPCNNIHNITCYYSSNIIEAIR